MSQIIARRVLRDSATKRKCGRQPPMKDKGKIGLDWEELALGETTL